MGLFWIKVRRSISDASAGAQALGVLAGDGSWLGCECRTAGAPRCELMLQKLGMAQKGREGVFQGCWQGPSVQLGCEVNWEMNKSLRVRFMCFEPLGSTELFILSYPSL